MGPFFDADVGWPCNVKWWVENRPAYIRSFFDTDGLIRPDSPSWGGNMGEIEESAALWPGIRGATINDAIGVMMGIKTIELSNVSDNQNIFLSSSFPQQSYTRMMHYDIARVLGKVVPDDSPRGFSGKVPDLPHTREMYDLTRMFYRARVAAWYYQDEYTLRTVADMTTYFYWEVSGGEKTGAVYLDVNLSVAYRCYYTYSGRRVYQDLVVYLGGKQSAGQSTRFFAKKQFDIRGIQAEFLMYVRYGSKSNIAAPDIDPPSALERVFAKFS